MKFAGLEIHLLASSPRTVLGRLLGVSRLWDGFEGGSSVSQMECWFGRRLRIQVCSWLDSMAFNGARFCF